MKSLHLLLFLAAAVLAVIIGLQGGTPAHCIGAYLLFFAAANFIAPQSTRLCATLTAAQILQLNLAAFKTRLPILPQFSTDFNGSLAVKDEEIIAHILSVPTVRDYDATNGFKANAANAEDLLTDVKVAMTRLRHTPVKIDYLTAHSSRKNLHLAAAEMGYALSKDIVDYVLSLVTDTNVTNELTESIANTSLETLEKVRTQMNLNGAQEMGRIGIVNSLFAQALSNDSRIASRDYYGQLNGNPGYRVFRNCAGFEAIYEYPDFPSNSINLSAFFCTKQGVVVAARVPNVAPAQAAELGIPQIGKFETLQDPETGFTLLGIGWQEAGTFDNYLTIASLYGAKVGTQGGAADTVVDKACFKIVTA